MTENNGNNWESPSDQGNMAPPMVHYPAPVPGAPVNFHPDQQGPAPGEDGGPVTVRNMTLEDAEFAGTMTTEAFRSKFVWATGEDKQVFIFILLRPIVKKFTSIQDYLLDNCS